MTFPPFDPYPEIIVGKQRSDIISEVKRKKRFQSIIVHKGSSRVGPVISFGTVSMPTSRHKHWD